MDVLDQLLAQAASTPKPLTMEELADYWGISLRTIQQDRADKVGVKWRRRGHQMICDFADADERLPGGRMEYFSPQELATYLGKSDRTIWNWRRDGKGPPYIPFRKCIFYYRKSEVYAWQKAQSAATLIASGCK